MMQHEIVSRDQWIAARQQLLAEEKQLTRLRDQLSAKRRELPWVKVEKDYVFDGPNGRETLADLFADRSQLVVRHFMFGPGWEEGCVGCSFWADHLDGAVMHLEHHDVTVVVVSRAPFAELEAFRRRMGWKFKWVSSNGSDFNYDYNVSFTEDDLARGKVYYNYGMTENAGEEMPGLSVFHKLPDGGIVHTYSSFARGNEPLLGTYSILDMTPKGRNEPGPGGNLTDWVRLHDRYEDGGGAACCHGAD
jgi:predicted dithiol-disulfide oxidoreductase (DUF899 family)